MSYPTLLLALLQPEVVANFQQLANDIQDTIREHEDELIRVAVGFVMGEVSPVAMMECEELIWLKPDAPPLGSRLRPRRTWEHILWFSKTPKPFVNLTACGRETDRIGFAGSIRFGVGGDSPIGHGQARSMTNGVARTPDVFTATIGSNGTGIDHPAVFPVALAEQLILTFSQERDRVAGTNENRSDCQSDFGLPLRLNDHARLNDERS